MTVYPSLLAMILGGYIDRGKHDVWEKCYEKNTDYYSRSPSGFLIPQHFDCFSRIQVDDLPFLFINGSKYENITVYNDSEWQNESQGKACDPQNRGVVNTVIEYSRARKWEWRDPNGKDNAPTSSFGHNLSVANCKRYRNESVDANCTESKRWCYQTLNPEEVLHFVHHIAAEP